MSKRKDDTSGVITSIFGNHAKHNGSALSFLDAIPLRKMIIWASFLGLLYLLRDFFGILIGTFVISYIGNSIVNWLEQRYKNRKLLIIGYFITIISLISGFNYWAGTLAWSESKVFIEKIKHDDPYTTLYKELNSSLPPSLMRRIDQALLEVANSKHLDDHSRPNTNKTVSLDSVSVTSVADGFMIKLGDGSAIQVDQSGKILKRIKHLKPGDLKAAQTPKDAKKTDSKAPAGKKVEDQNQKSDEEVEENAKNLGKALQSASKDYASLAIKFVSKFFKTLAKVVIQTIISLIFAFLIIWDLPKIKAGIANLESSRLGEAYKQVAPSVVNFGQLLGKAFQAQTLIALTNTALTALGMVLLFIPGIGFLSLIVFACSFIPVAGVFISTAPMAIVALVNGGIVKCIAVVVMVIVVHAVEAYILNPVIYSAHLKLHPLLVLVVLVVAEHLFGVWGLIVAVPLTVYVYRHVILGDSEVDVEPDTTTPTDTAESEAETNAEAEAKPSPENADTNKEPDSTQAPDEASEAETEKPADKPES